MDDWTVAVAELLNHAPAEPVRSTSSIAALARSAGLTPSCVHNRLQRGWTLSAALTIRPRTPEYPRLRLLCRRYGRCPATVRYRLRLGWPLRRALLAQPYSAPRLATHGLKRASFAGMCRAAGVSASTVRGRLMRGWTLRDALSAPGREACA